MTENPEHAKHPYLGVEDTLSNQGAAPVSFDEEFQRVVRQVQGQSEQYFPESGGCA